MHIWHALTNQLVIKWCSDTITRHLVQNLGNKTCLPSSAHALQTIYVPQKWISTGLNWFDCSETLPNSPCADLLLNLMILCLNAQKLQLDQEVILTTKLLTTKNRWSLKAKVLWNKSHHISTDFSTKTLTIFNFENWNKPSQQTQKATNAMWSRREFAKQRRITLQPQQQNKYSLQ